MSMLGELQGASTDSITNLASRPTVPGCFSLGVFSTIPYHYIWAIHEWQMFLICFHTTPLRHWLLCLSPFNFRKKLSILITTSDICYVRPYGIQMWTNADRISTNRRFTGADNKPLLSRWRVLVPCCIWSVIFVLFARHDLPGVSGSKHPRFRTW